MFESSQTYSYLFALTTKLRRGKRASVFPSIPAKGYLILFNLLSTRCNKDWKSWDLLKADLGITEKFRFVVYRRMYSGVSKYHEKKFQFRSDLPSAVSTWTKLSSTVTEISSLYFLDSRKNLHHWKDRNHVIRIRIAPTPARTIAIQEMLWININPKQKAPIPHIRFATVPCLRADQFALQADMNSGSDILYLIEIGFIFHR